MTNNVLDWLDETAKRSPEKIAFRNERSALSFEELEIVKCHLGSRLINAGYHKEPVLIYMEKSPEQIAAFFGVVAAGCFYVPIDDEMPASRIDLIIKNCNPRVMIYDEGTADKAKDLSFEGEMIPYGTIWETRTDNEALERVHDESIDTDPIYIVFTSGSTGVPKGVVANHRSVIDYINQLSEVLGFDENTVFGNQSPLYFDAY